MVGGRERERERETESSAPGQGRGPALARGGRGIADGLARQHGAAGRRIDRRVPGEIMKRNACPTASNKRAY